jgi:hypothetical protein
MWLIAVIARKKYRDPTRHSNLHPQTPEPEIELGAVPHWHS